MYVCLVAQRLAGLERVSDALLRLALAAKGEKCLALKVKQVLFAHECSCRDAPAGKDEGRPAGHFLVVLGSESGFAHHENAGLKGAQRRDSRRGNSDARL